MRAWLASLVFVLTTSAAVAKPGAIVIPPAEVDIGAGTPIGESTGSTSTEIRAGVHTASFYWKPTRFDIGVGYAGSFRTLNATTVMRPIGVLAEPADGNDNKLELHGLYFSFAYAIENHRYWRTWLGGRIEGLNGDINGRSVALIGAAARVASELYTTGAGAGSSNRAAAFFSGAFAVGVYVEAVYRALPTELGPVGVAAGLTMRVPFIAAVGD